MKINTLRNRVYILVLFAILIQLGAKAQVNQTIEQKSKVMHLGAIQYVVNRNGEYNDKGLKFQEVIHLKGFLKSDLNIAINNQFRIHPILKKFDQLSQTDDQLVFTNQIHSSEEVWFSKLIIDIKDEKIRLTFSLLEKGKKRTINHPTSTKASVIPRLFYWSAPMAEGGSRMSYRHKYRIQNNIIIPTIKHFIQYKNEIFEVLGKVMENNDIASDNW